MQAACLPAASLAQLLREAALREEWRGQRESALLHSLGPQSLAGLLGLGPGSGPGVGSADGRMLADQVAALTEVRARRSGYRERSIGSVWRLGRELLRQRCAVGRAVCLLKGGVECARTAVCCDRTMPHHGTTRTTAPPHAAHDYGRWCCQVACKACQVPPANTTYCM